MEEFFVFIFADRQKFQIFVFFLIANLVIFTEFQECLEIHAEFY